LRFHNFSMAQPIRAFLLFTIVMGSSSAVDPT